MKRSLVYLGALLVMLVLAWYLTNSLFGFGSDVVVRILRAVFLAAVIWLAGAALVWAARHSKERTWLGVGLVVLASLVLIPPIFHEHEPHASRLLENNPLLAFLLPQLLPCLALVMTALLLYIGLRSFSTPAGPDPDTSEETTGTGQKSSRMGAVNLALSGLVLAGGLYHLYWLFVWDSTYDALDVFFLAIPILTALFSAALLGELLAGRQKLLALLSAILVPFLLIGVFRSAKHVDFRELTQARAERISQALEKFHARHGIYPSRLGQLVPGTMLSIPVPMVLYGQDWCYQGSGDSYRLGYVDREHWSSPELFSQVYKTQGAARGEGELCEAALAAMKARYPKFYGLGYRGQ